MAILTQTEKALIRVLRDVWDDKEFVLGVITDLETDEERSFVLNYIKDNAAATPEDIVLLALQIDAERK